MCAHLSCKILTRNPQACVEGRNCGKGKPCLSHRWEVGIISSSSGSTGAYTEKIYAIRGMGGSTIADYSHGNVRCICFLRLYSHGLASGARRAQHGLVIGSEDKCVVRAVGQILPSCCSFVYILPSAHSKRESHVLCKTGRAGKAYTLPCVGSLIAWKSKAL